MPKIDVLNMAGSKVSELELCESIFAIEPNASAMHIAVVNYLANRRQGTQSTLTRSEVSGGGKKPWRQKGTGNARQGSTRAPQWIKGGVVFAPKSRDFSKKMNITAKRVALFSALSQKIRDDEVVVVDTLSVKEGKTKEMVAFLKAMNFEKTVLLVMADGNVLVRRAASNIQTVTTMPVELISCYDVVKNVKIVFAKAAIEKLQDSYGEEENEQEVAE